MRNGHKNPIFTDYTIDYAGDMIFKVSEKFFLYLLVFYYSHVKPSLKKVSDQIHYI